LGFALFDPAARGRLKNSDVVEARLGAKTARGGERHVSTLDGIDGLVPVDSLSDDAEEGDHAMLRVVSVPPDGKIRLSGRTELATLSVPPTVAAWIQGDLRPLSMLVGDACELRWDDTTAPTPSIEIAARSAYELDAAAGALSAAVGGPLLMLTVPA